MNELKEKKKLKQSTSTTETDTPKFLLFGKPDLTEEEVEAVVAVIRSGWIGTGPVCKKFEEEFSAYLGAYNAVAVNSATTGLMLALAASIGEGAEVVTTPMTFAATVNACLALRIRPRFVDVDEHGLMNPEHLEAMRDISGTKIKAVLPIHYTGAVCDMQRIMNWANIHHLKVIEDAAHAFDADFVGPMIGKDPGRRQKVGTIGDFTVFSFYATKNITCGEGGMVLCKSSEASERIRALSSQGLSAGAWRRYDSGPVREYQVIHPGYKGNLTDMAAAMALTQLRRWPEMKVKRAAVWRIYEDAFGYKEPGHSQHLFTIRVKNRERVRKSLHDLGIGTGVHFNALHLEPGYHFLGYKKGDFPIAERIGEETMSLPLSSTMNEGDAHRVVEAVRKVTDVKE